MRVFIAGNVHDEIEQGHEVLFFDEVTEFLANVVFDDLEQILLVRNCEYVFRLGELLAQTCNCACLNCANPQSVSIVQRLTYQRAGFRILCHDLGVQNVHL